MKKQNLQNERLDEIGLRLLAAARLQSDQINDIASATHLFDSVKARIKAEQLYREATSPWAEFWARWRTSFIAATATAALLTAVGVFVFLSGDSPDRGLSQQTMNKASDTAAQSVVAFLDVNETLAIEHASPKMVAARNTPARTPRPRPEREEMSDFYALTYDQDSDDDLRIVRVELPRSSLLAMGLGSHSENESEEVKADLLVGADGITRAVRFAK